MEKIFIEELKTKVYVISGQNEKGNYKFVSYEMELPNGITVTMSDTNKTSNLAKSHKIVYEDKIKNKR